MPDPYDDATLTDEEIVTRSAGTPALQVADDSDDTGDDTGDTSDTSDTGDDSDDDSGDDAA